MHNGRQLYTNTIPVSTEQDPQRQWPQVCGLDRIICSAIKIEATQHKREKASFHPDINQRYPRVSARGNPTNNTLQTAGRHRLAAIHTPARPFAATGITISPGPALPSDWVKKLRRTGSWAHVSGLVLALPEI